MLHATVVLRVFRNRQGRVVVDVENRRRVELVAHCHEQIAKELDFGASSDGSNEFGFCGGKQTRNQYVYTLQHVLQAELSVDRLVELGRILATAHDFPKRVFENVMKFESY